MTTMFSWLQFAVARASTMNRRVSSGDVVCSNLSATRRPSQVSRAKYTTPMPPRPSSRMISYWPMRAEGGAPGTSGASQFGAGVTPSGTMVRLPIDGGGLFEGVNAGVTAPENTAVAALTCPGTRGTISERPRSHSESSRGVSLLCGAFICRSPTGRADAAEAIIPLFQGYPSLARSASDSSPEPCQLARLAFASFFCRGATSLWTSLFLQSLDSCARVSSLESRVSSRPRDGAGLSATAAYKHRLRVFGALSVQHRSSKHAEPAALGARRCYISGHVRPLAQSVDWFGRSLGRRGAARQHRARTAERRSGNNHGRDEHCRPARHRGLRRPRLFVGGRGARAHGIAARAGHDSKRRRRHLQDLARAHRRDLRGGDAAFHARPARARGRRLAS